MMASSYKHNIGMTINVGEIIFDIYLGNGFFHTKSCPEMLYFNNRHNHSYFEIQLILNGSGVMKIEGEHIHFDGKNAFLIFPGVYHVLELTSDSEIIRRCFYFNYNNTSVKQFYSTIPEINEIQALLTDGSKKYYRVSDFPDSIERYLEDIISELIERKLFYHVSVKSIFSCMIIQLLRAFAGDKRGKYSINEDEYNALRIYTIEKFFNERHSEDVKVEDLAIILGVTVRQVNRVIKKFFGVTFREKLSKTRVEVAKDLLKNTDVSIYDISLMVGYGSTVGFNSAFKKYTGTTPGMFRSNSNLSESPKNY